MTLARVYASLALQNRGRWSVDVAGLFAALLLGLRAEIHAPGRRPGCRAVAGGSGCYRVC